MAGDHWNMVVVLAQVCQIDMRTYTGRQKGQLLQAAKILRDAEITIEDVQQFGAWWFKEDWRGKRGSPPSPSQIRQEWGRYEAAKKADAPSLAFYS